MHFASLMCGRRENGMGDGGGRSPVPRRHGPRCPAINFGEGRATTPVPVNREGTGHSSETGHPEGCYESRWRWDIFGTVGVWAVVVQRMLRGSLRDIEAGWDGQKWRQG